VTRRKGQASGSRVDERLQRVLRKHAANEGARKTGNCTAPISSHDKQSANKADHGDDEGVADVCDRVESTRVEVHRDP
jgi:hypothetical protein